MVAQRTLDVFCCGRRLHGAVRSTEFDDGECIQDGTCEPTSATLSTVHATGAVAIGRVPTRTRTVAFWVADRSDSLMRDDRLGDALRELEGARTPEIITTQNSADTQPVMAYRMILNE